MRKDSVDTSFHRDNVKSGLDHESSNIKGNSRYTLANFAGLFDPNIKKVKTVSLGGKRFLFEKFIASLGIEIDATCYEMDTKVLPIAKKNKPKYVKLEEKNIFSYRYMANENIIWFDFMCFLSTININQLIRYIEKSKFRHSFTFAFTYTIDPRRDTKGIIEQYEKDFPKYKESGVVDHISKVIEKSGVVKVTDSIIVHYKNKDVSPSAMQMGLYMLKIEKK